MTRTLATALLLLAAPLAAQPAAHSISPGMTRAQVVASLGEPLTSRQMNEFTYVFYRNECTRACGMNDIVVLRSDSVVDAVFRSPTRHYTGKSSSPEPISARAARSAAATEKPAVLTAPPRMKPGAANDIRPSIPENALIVRPAPPNQPHKKTP